MMMLSQSFEAFSGVNKEPQARFTIRFWMTNSFPSAKEMSSVFCREGLIRDCYERKICMPPKKKKKRYIYVIFNGLFHKLVVD